jgi:hypothetical protein
LFAVKYQCMNSCVFKKSTISTVGMSNRLLMEKLLSGKQKNTQNEVLKKEN